MSVKIMSMVFDRYPNGGGEMMLALALADHSYDDGTNIYPSIKSLAEKTRQSERTVQYQLRRMEKSGWLILVNSGNGGRNQRREYVINPEWLKGADIAPPIKGATDDTKGADSGIKGCNPAQERVQPIAPAYNHHRTIKEPLENHQRASAPKNKADKTLDFSSWPHEPDKQVWADYEKLRRQKKAPITQTVINRLGSEIKKASSMGYSVDDFLSECILRGWHGGKADWLENKNEKNKSGASTKSYSQKFDPVAFVNKNRTSYDRNHRTIIDV